MLQGFPLVYDIVSICRHSRATSDIRFAACSLNEAADGPADQLSSSEKKLRTVRKKLQQADALRLRAEGGEKLTQQEIEKLQKVSAW